MLRSRRLLAGLGVWALLELGLLVWVGQAIGGWPLLAALAAQAALGGWTLRRAGRRAWASLGELRHDKVSPESLSDSALVASGSILVMMPGFLSDAVGALCLLPPTRPLARSISSALVVPLTRGIREQAGLLDAHLNPSTVVEGEVLPAEPPPSGGIVIAGEVED